MPRPGEGAPTRSLPCSSCPYVCDTPSGVWAHTEYEKLRDYDKPTGDQPFAPFMCHATPEHYCHGWVVVHSNRAEVLSDGGEHPYDVMALRIFPSTNGVPESDVMLWESGNAAADYGQQEIHEPSIAARATVDKLTRKYPRIKKG